MNKNNVISVKKSTSSKTHKSKKKMLLLKIRSLLGKTPGYNTMTVNDKHRRSDEIVKELIKEKHDKQRLNFARRHATERLTRKKTGEALTKRYRNFTKKSLMKGPLESSPLQKEVVLNNNS